MERLFNRIYYYRSFFVLYLLFEHFLSNENKVRIERKFSVNELMPPEIENILKLHPSFFSEIYQKRRINNIYFDNDELQCYFDNLDGVERRFKVRIRWYGDTFGQIRNPYLEIKIKKSNSGAKIRYPLRDFESQSLSDTNILQGLFDQSDLTEYVAIFVKNLKPVMLNSYDRNYYLSFDKAYRTTIDSNLRYYKIDSIFKHCINRSGVPIDSVLELKYDGDHEQGAEVVASNLPFRLSRHSKYVKGIEYLSE